MQIEGNFNSDFNKWNKSTEEAKIGSKGDKAKMKLVSSFSDTRRIVRNCSVIIESNLFVTRDRCVD